MNELPNHALLANLLAQRADFPHLAPEIDAHIKKRFERTVAVLVLDMCHGVIFYLAMIRQTHATAMPAVRDNRGVTIKTVADDLFAVFPTSADALEGALDIQRAFAAINAAVPCDQDIHGSIGIGYGLTLVLDEVDLFGLEVNLASKLGEDFACGDEILLTAAAYAGLPAGRYLCSPVAFELHQQEFAAHRYEGRDLRRAGEGK